MSPRGRKIKINGQPYELVVLRVEEFDPFDGRPRTCSLLFDGERAELNLGSREEQVEANQFIVALLPSKAIRRRRR